MPLPQSPAAYRLVDEDSGNFYVGSATNLRHRVTNHRSFIERGNHPNRQVREGLPNWDRVRIEYIECTDTQSARRLEDSLVDFHHGEEEMLNVAISGNIAPSTTGRVYTSAQISESSEMSRTPEARQRRSERLKGQGKSEEARQRMSKSAIERGNNFSAEGIARGRAARSTPVIVDGVKYESARAAGRAHDMCSHTVKARVNSPNFSNWSFDQKEV
jgi:group I intron endonuclease